MWSASVSFTLFSDGIELSPISNIDMEENSADLNSVFGLFYLRHDLTRDVVLNMNVQLLVNIVEAKGRTSVSRKQSSDTSSKMRRSESTEVVDSAG